MNSVLLTIGLLVQQMPCTKERVGRVEIVRDFYLAGDRQKVVCILLQRPDLYVWVPLNR